MHSVDYVANLAIILFFWEILVDVSIFISSLFLFNLLRRCIPVMHILNCLVGKKKKTMSSPCLDEADVNNHFCFLFFHFLSNLTVLETWNGRKELHQNSKYVTFPRFSVFLVLCYMCIEFEVLIEGFLGKMTYIQNPTFWEIKKKPFQHLNQWKFLDIFVLYKCMNCVTT
jgi:hypothetical protein